MSEGKKYDGEKPKMYLLPPKTLLEVAKVLTFGAAKYDEHNWKKLDNLQNRYSGAALRHIFAHLDGEELDEETGLDHIAHAICCLMFKLEAKLENGKSKEAGLGEPVSIEYRESDRPFERGLSDYEERGLRDVEYRLQHGQTPKDSNRI